MARYVRTYVRTYVVGLAHERLLNRFTLYRPVGPFR